VGWYGIEEDGLTIKDISIKVPISNNPYNDHAVVATFFFKKANDFINATNLMIKENYRINNEFYVDALPRFLKKMNKRPVIFDIDLHIGWGKPDELEEYKKIEKIIKSKENPKNLTKEEKRLTPLWKKHFTEA